MFYGWSSNMQSASCKKKMTWPAPVTLEIKGKGTENERGKQWKGEEKEKRKQSMQKSEVEGKNITCYDTQTMIVWWTMKGLLTDDIEVEQLLLNFKISKTIQLGTSSWTTNYN